MDYFNENRTTDNCWASNDEIKSSLHKIPLNDFNSAYGGIPLYTDSDAVYVDQTDNHSLIIGSTGSKKTRLIGMPALQTYAISGESFIATDPKGELYKKTYKILKDRDYNIFLLNLRNPKKSNSWNPLKIPYLQYHNGEEDKAREFVIDMAGSIAKTGKAREPYWENSAADLLAGLILLMIEYAKENEINFKSLRVLRMEALKNIENDKTYIQKYFLPNLEKSSLLCSLLSGTAELTEQSRSCIISEFDQAMSPFFCQENLIDMLSNNEIDMSEIGKTKTAVFLIIPDENTIYNKLISLFIKQCYMELLREAEKHPNNSLPKRVNFLLDEFSNLPEIKDFPAMITASRSRNIRFNLIIQGESQLIDKYGYNSETIISNCNNWIYLYSHEYPLMEKLVRMAGKKTKNEPMISISMLQSLKKEKGEAYLRYGRNRPFITNLLDIDRYPNIAQGEENIQYPENNSKATAVFDFQEYCAMMNNNDDIIVEPTFSDKLVNSKNNIIDKNIDEFNIVKNFNEESPHNKFFLKTNIEHCYGSHGLVLPIIKEIQHFNEKNPDKKIIIENINQFEGTLHIATSIIPDYIRGMISIAGYESKHICEICGARGKLKKIGENYMTLCKRHLKAKKEAKDNNKLFEKIYRKEILKYEKKLSSKHKILIQI
jgi:type IV secretion system protein VirD4